MLWARYREMLVHDVAGQVAVYHAGEKSTRVLVGEICGFSKSQEMTKPSQETEACRFWQRWRLNVGSYGAADACTGQRCDCDDHG